MLAALAYIEREREQTLEEANASKPNDVFVSMPVGRVGWDRPNTDKLLQEFTSEPVVLALIKAGFAQRSRRFLDLFLENFRRYARRMSW